MTVTASPVNTQQSQWFATWFDSPHYHKLYSHRDDNEAAGFIDALTEHLGVQPLQTALDLGCGAGRHARYLASKGLRVTGIDLAANSIRQAKMSEHETLRFMQGDMRVPFGKQAFDYLFSFFTSFGYFDDFFEHMVVVRNIANALKPGGKLVLDYLNVRYAEERLKPRETATLHGITYDVTRWSDERHFFKRIVIDDENIGQTLEHVERVAKFTVHDFKTMFALQGLNFEDVRGDYSLGEYDVNRSPRMILFASKPSAATTNIGLLHGMEANRIHLAA